MAKCPPENQRKRLRCSASPRANYGLRDLLWWHLLRAMKTVPSVLCAAGILAVSCLAQQPAAPAAPAASAVAKVEAKDVTPDEAEKLLAENPGMIVLDVRTPEEFEHEHIKGAVNVNLFDTDFDAAVAALDQTKPVLVHCQAGRRSSQALLDLAGKVKFAKVYHLSSGIKGWKDAKKPVEGKELPGVGRLGPGSKGKPAAAPATAPAAPAPAPNAK